MARMTMAAFLSKIFHRKLSELGADVVTEENSHLELSAQIPTLGASARIGLIAGNSQLPMLLAERAKQRELPLFIAGIEGDASEEISAYANSMKNLKIGQVGAMITFFNAHDVTDVIMAGGVSPAKRFSDVGLDARGAMVLSKARSRKDDVVMRALANEIELSGMRVVTCASLMPEALAESGMHSGKKLSATERSDVEEGLRLIGRLRRISCRTDGRDEARGCRRCGGH